ncbi:hypothetical protein U6B65_12415 [Oscillospiraceae bacterium MB08-C2-2]|nr:hypothetical protein U6B65_12415 [Oscillospiraceae bacterium MB08-C2-2]
MLEINDRQEPGLLHRLAGKLTKAKLQLERETLFGKSYGRLRVSSLEKEADWWRVYQYLGRYGRRLLLPEGVEVPGGVPLLGFHSGLFDTEVLFHTACAIISRSRMQMYRRLVGLIDPDGRYVSQLAGLLKYFTAVKVHTDRPDLYRPACREMMETFGAPVMICESLAGLEGCVMVLCPQPFETEQPLRLSGPVLGDENIRLPCKFDLISHLEVELPQDIKEKLPPGVSPHEFAGALYELLDIRNQPLVAKNMRYNHKVSSLGEVVGLLARQFEVATSNTPPCEAREEERVTTRSPFSVEL